MFTAEEVTAAIKGARVAFMAAREVHQDEHCWNADETASEIVEIALSNLRLR